MDTTRAALAAPLHGRYTTLVPLDRAQAAAVFPHVAGPGNEALWTFVPDGPFATEEEWLRMVEVLCAGEAVRFVVCGEGSGGSGGEGEEGDGKGKEALPPPAGLPAGLLSYESLALDHRRVEVGLVLGRPLQRTRAATEAVYLLLQRAFAAGVQRVEWKTDSQNAASRAAATRLGFVEEGVLRKHMILHGRRRDTVWLSMTDDEWPAARAALEGWLDAGNFDKEGQQRQSLQSFRQ